MADIFISYAGEDRPWVEKFAQALTDQGWSVWWDRSIPFGQSYQTVIEQALRDASCVFVIWSSHSVDSSWVWAEAEEARSRNILIPIAIDGSAPPLVFRQIQTADLSQWKIDPPAPLDTKLLRDLESLIGKPASLLSVPVQSESIAQQISSEVTEPEQAVVDLPLPISDKVVRHEQQSSTGPTAKQSKKGFSTVHLVGVSALLFVVLATVFMMNDGQPKVPEIHDFSVLPQVIDVGDVAALSWHTENVSKIEIKGFGYLASSGSKSVRPDESTTYTLVITSPEGLSIQREVELFVNSSTAESTNDAAVNELLAVANEAIKAHDFEQAEALIKQAQRIAPDSEEVLKTIDYLTAEGVRELLRLARQAIKSRDFSGAKKLLDQTQENAAHEVTVQQTLDYYEASKTLYEQRLATEEKLLALKKAEAEAKSKAASDAARKEQAADKWRLEQEAKSRQQAYELQQKQLEEIKAQEQQAAARTEQEMTEAERLQIEEDEKNLSEEEIRARRERTDKFVKDFLKRLHR